MEDLQYIEKTARQEIEQRDKQEKSGWRNLQKVSEQQRNLTIFG
jgi:hypothetical protein